VEFFDLDLVVLTTSQDAEAITAALLATFASYRFDELYRTPKEISCFCQRWRKCVGGGKACFATTMDRYPHVVLGHCLNHRIQLAAGLPSKLCRLSVVSRLLLRSFILSTACRKKMPWRSVRQLSENKW